MFQHLMALRMIRVHKDGKNSDQHGYLLLNLF
uniref:Uncharacterized protein n=1 Tax=Anguilla anguilla TaxID=7936 RepID=A0A0E9TX18_ANGAN